jgi:hypothetical protein
MNAFTYQRVCYLCMKYKKKLGYRSRLVMYQNMYDYCKSNEIQ